MPVNPSPGQTSSFQLGLPFQTQSLAFSPKSKDISDIAVMGFIGQYRLESCTKLTCMDQLKWLMSAAQIYVFRFHLGSKGFSDMSISSVIRVNDKLLVIDALIKFRDWG